MTLNIIAPGIDTSFSTKLNENFNATKVIIIDNSTTLNLSATNTTVENSLELPDISAATLAKSKYLKFSILMNTAVSAGNGGNALTYFKLQEKYLGGSYADVVPETLTNSIGQIMSNSSFSTITFIYPISANDYIYGCKLKVFTKGFGSAVSTTGAVSVTQTTVELCT